MNSTAIDSLPGSRDSFSHLHDLLEEVTARLGSSIRPKRPKSEQEDSTDTGCSSKSLLVDAKVHFKCTGLSLKHTKDSTLRDKVHAEQYAAQLLARPVVAVPFAEQLPGVMAKIKQRLILGGEQWQDGVTIDDYGACILTNIYESFSTLSESRLRAYGNYLISHKEPALLSHLEKLFSLGNLVQTEQLSTVFSLLEAEPTVESDTLSIPLSFRADMSLLLPQLDQEETQRVPIWWETSGEISVSRSSKDEYQIEVTLNANEFLSALMKQVSLIIESVVDLANNAFVLPTKKQQSLKRSGSSFMVMPPPPPCAKKLPRPRGLELLSRAAASRPIVSPDLVALHGCVHRIPELRLEEEDTESVINELSVDQCEHIVDDIFGDTDTALLHLPTKETKTF